MRGRAGGHHDERVEPQTIERAVESSARVLVVGGEGGAITLISVREVGAKLRRLSGDNRKGSDGLRKLRR